VALLDPVTGDERAGFTTFITRLPAPTADQPVFGPLLDVALVVPFGARPALAPDGTSVAPESAEVAPLRTLTEALISHQDVPVTLAAVPETVDALNRLQGGNDLVAQLRSSLAFRQVLAATYVRTDVSALVESGLTQEVQDQLTAGGRTLGELLGDGRPPDRRTVVLSPGLRASGLRQLRDLGFFQAIAPPGLLADDPVPEPGEPVGPAPTTKDELVIGGDRFGSVLVADAALTAALRPAPDADPVLAAYHLLAELAVIALDQASITRAGGSRGIVLWAGDDWRPDPVFLDALLTALGASATLVTPRTVDDLFTTVTASRDADGAPVTRRLADLAGPQLDPAYVTGLALTRITLGSFEQFVGSTSPLLADLRERLLVASSTDLDDAERAAFLQAVNAAIGRQQAAVQPVENGTQTLTSRNSRIIFVIHKTTDDPLTVKVTLRSDKLEFDGGGEVTLTLRDRSTVVEIPVRALATGAFPLEVQLASPDYRGPGRGFLLSSSTITIRSLAVPGVGIVISVGALIVLCLWWLSHIRAERRQRRARSEQVHPTGALDAGTVTVSGDGERT
jgi:hypothetical protein